MFSPDFLDPVFGIVIDCLAFDVDRTRGRREPEALTRFRDPTELSVVARHHEGVARLVHDEAREAGKRGMVRPHDLDPKTYEFASRDVPVLTGAPH
ncbi:MAG TPA: hypothetical protein VM889_13220 [Candidatus Thermoplasmatota archaeon]|nr:hypothetical protein [Candidatus Thermoplasmatota archaeon]